MDVSQCQLLEEKAGEGKAAKAARHLFGPPAAPVQGKNLGSDQPVESHSHITHYDMVAARTQP